VKVPCHHESTIRNQVEILDVDIAPYYDGSRAIDAGKVEYKLSEVCLNYSPVAIVSLRRRV